jgi:hypothetical protein
MNAHICVHVSGFHILGADGGNPLGSLDSIATAVYFKINVADAASVSLGEVCRDILWPAVQKHHAANVNNLSLVHCKHGQSRWVLNLLPTY